MRIAFILLLLIVPQGKKVMECTHDFFLSNGQGLFYIHSRDGLFLKSKSGETVKHHSENLLGEIGGMDMTSYFRLLVFFDKIPGFQILDNTLSPHTDLVDLNLLGYPFVSSMCTSTNNSYWMYDGTSFELLRIDEKGKELSRSGNLTTVIGRPLDVFKMKESGKRLYLAEKGTGIFVFDQFGTFMKSIEVPGFLDFSVTEDIVYLLSEGEVYKKRINKPFLEELTVSILPDAMYIDADADNLYLGDGQKIRSYPRQSP